MSWMNQTHLYRCRFEYFLQDLWFKTRWYIMGEKCSSALHSQHAVLLFCSQILFIDWTHLLISSCHSHLLSPFSSDRPSDIFLLPFPSILLPITSATLLSSCLTWLDPLSFLPALLPSFPASLAWPISLMTSSGILSHANNDNRNPVSLRFARGWISPESPNSKINPCSWGSQKMVFQQTMMTVF